eukprot:XP_001696430.1 predicted protein [Chlamydomonas reinhardtii]
MWTSTYENTMVT